MRWHHFILAMAFGWTLAGSAHAQAEAPLAFGVINQRSVPLTAQSWNPILSYVGRKVGAPLALKMGKTAPETTAMTVRGEHAFAYTNHMFTPERDRIGYKVVLRMRGEPIHGAIVVRDDSPIRSVADLAGARVAFPSKEAFVGYWLPMDHLLKSGVQVNEVFAGNQEGAMSQLQFGEVAAAAVNRKLLSRYAQREDFRYRVIWVSEPYLDIPVMAHPSLSPRLVEAVRAAFIGMDQDPDGRRALQASADGLGSRELWSFVRADDAEYDNYRRFYRSTVVKGD
ncbi:MAG: phosphate/phosphite/phosphonate ABC transporter substrate-binding protein [Pseudomonadota bacterium]